MELLAPAGNIEAAKAALNAGADACYIGGAFSARAYAQNFSLEEIGQILRYARLRGRRVYVAVNTMLKEREFPEALAYVQKLYEMGVDAIIASDWGLIRAMCAQMPELPVHLSTQAGVCTADGATQAQALGAQRVVAAREVSLETLAQMAQAGVEVEAFCHGALCSGISGACLLSSGMGRRSGNRGRCAQPCRLPYTLAGQRAYHLSAADLCTVDMLARFAGAGVASIKIEGRMKRVEYVEIVVSAYRRALDTLDFDAEAAKEELKKIYNRGGFTHGYLLGDRDVTFPARQNHMGVRVGEVARRDGRGRALVRTGAELVKGDGIEFAGQESHGGLTIGYADAAPGGYWIPAPAEAQVGDGVYRTTDTRQLTAAAELGRERKIPVRMELRAAEGKSCAMQAYGEGCEASATGSPPERAEKPVNPDVLKKYLCKTGDTPFVAAEVDLQIEGNPFLPASAINALRRECLGALEQAVCDARAPYMPRAGKPASLPPAPKARKPYLAAQVKTAAQAAAAWQGGAGRVYYWPRELRAEDVQKIEKCGELWLVLPPFWTAADEARLRQVCAGGHPFDGALVGNIGQFAIGRALFGRLAADYWLNCANAAAAWQITELGAETVTFSAELAAGELGFWGDGEAVVYGNFPVMNLRHCPVKKAAGCAACGKAPMWDDKGREYPMLRSGLAECLMQPLSPEKLIWTDVGGLGCRGLRLVFGLERPEEAQRVTEAYAAAMAGDGRARLQAQPGRLSRGVE